VTTTLAAMQAGSFSMKWIALVEGCQYVLTDCQDEAAVQAALAGTDWEAAAIIPWLRVDLKNEQRISPLYSFIPNQSRCVLRVGDHDGADTFGVFVHRRLSGAETELTVTADRNDTTISVRSTTGFAASGEIYIGTENISYLGVTSTTFTGCTRGKYSPFGCASTGTGGTRFANHHRVANDTSGVLMSSVVSQLPRTWMGKRVGVWLHTWNGSALNTRADAQLVYAGRLVGIADDSKSFETVLEVEPFLEEVRNGVIGKDLWGGTIPPGLQLVTGRVFKAADWKLGSAVKTANNLTVVSSGASGTNQINAGRYSLSELCEALSAWMAGEQTAARLYGFYSWASPVTSNVGLRTKCYWRIDDASTTTCTFSIEMPGEVFAFLGLGTQEPGLTGQSEKWVKTKKTNENHIAQGESTPFTTVIFRPTAGGRLGQEFNTESSTYSVENERGTFVGQRSLLPKNIQDSCPDSVEWGLFLLDERILLVGTYDDGVLTSCWLAPFQLASDKDTAALSYIGRRADEPEAGDILLRQVFMFEASFFTLWMTLLHSSGTSGYTSTFDTLGYGLGLGLPGDLCSDDMERSVSNLPGAYLPLAVFIDEPTKFEDLFSADLRIRRSFIRWKQEKIEMAHWQTPTEVSAVATLEEANKAEPSGTEADHRAPTQEAQLTQRPIVKIDYSKDFATGRDGPYLKSVTIEDQTAVDDMGGNVKPETMKMRNSFAQLVNTGAAIESLLPGFIAFMPCISRPWRELTRSTDLRSFEDIAPGDVVLVIDDWARDPVTGTRGIERAAVVTGCWYDLRTITGGATVMWLDAHRAGTYCPAADIDETYSSGGYTAGYNNATATLRCHAHHYSTSVTYTSKRGGTVVLTEDNDATHIDVGDKLLIVERDPADPAAPLSWERECLSQSGDDIVMTSTLSAPAFDSTKRYRVTFQKYSQVQLSQQDFAYQADSADLQVEDTTPAYHPSITTEQLAYVADAGTTPGEFIADIAARDGGAYDVGHDRALAYTLNAYHDAVSCHSAPCLWSEYTDDAGNSGGWYTIWIGVVFLGTEHSSATVGRVATIAPFFRSSSAGNAGYIRITLSRSPPVTASGADGDNVTDDARFTDAFAQGEWTTTSATWQTGADIEFSLGTKDLSFGYVFVTIEKRGYGQTRGIAKFSEGPRVVTS
jgi:hypothetical protein